MKTTQPILIYIVFGIFLHLKLTGQIDWSWWYITAPLWGYIAATFVTAFVVAAWKVARGQSKQTVRQ